MGKTNNILGIKGTIGNIVFKSNGTVSQKPAPKGAENMATRTKENMSEFGRAGSAGRVFRSAFASVAKDLITTATGQITAVMVAVIGLDTVNARGLRKVLNANTGSLMAKCGRIFKNSIFEALRTNASFVIDATGNGNVDFVLPISGAGDLIVPEGATHVKVVRIIAKVDFESGNAPEVVQTSTSQSAVDAPIFNLPTMNFTNAVTAGEQVIAIASLEFSQLVNGVYYKLGSSYYIADSVLA